MIAVGRKRLKAMITEAIGSRTRGNAVLRISRPPDTTALVPSRTAPDTK